MHIAKRKEGEEAKAKEEIKIIPFLIALEFIPEIRGGIWCCRFAGGEEGSSGDSVIWDLEFFVTLVGGETLLFIYVTSHCSLWRLSLICLRLISIFSFLVFSLILLCRTSFGFLQSRRKARGSSRFLFHCGWAEFAFVIIYVVAYVTVSFHLWFRLSVRHISNINY